MGGGGEELVMEEKRSVCRRPSGSRCGGVSGAGPRGRPRRVQSEVGCFERGSRVPPAFWVFFF